MHACANRLHNGHAKGHQRSLTLVPIESVHAYKWPIVTLVLFCTVSEMLRLQGQISRHSPTKCVRLAWALSHFWTSLIWQKQRIRRRFVVEDFMILTCIGLIQHQHFTDGWRCWPWLLQCSQLNQST